MRLLRTPQGKAVLQEEGQSRAGLQQDSDLGSQVPGKVEAGSHKSRGKPPSRPLCSPSTEQFLIFAFFNISLRYIRILVSKSPNS